jgi:hypothetical protein
MQNQGLSIFMGKKGDLNQVDAIAREFGMLGKEIKAFGRFLEQ